MTPQYAIGIRDFAEGIGNWRMWGRLGWAEVKRRYRRTTIGPFWTTLSLSIFVVALGIVWSTLWKASIAEYLPFLCAGLIAWNFVSTTILESCATFSTHEPLIKQIQFPYSILTCAVVWRNFIVFLHNLVVLVVVSAVCQVPPTLNTILVLPGLLLVAINAIWIGTVLGMICARFRDIQQLMTSMFQIALFVTPVFWKVEQLTESRRIFVDINVLFHLIDIVRSPLLGQAPAMESYVAVLIVTVVGWLATLEFYGRFRRRLPYWL